MFGERCHAIKSAFLTLAVIGTASSGWGTEGVSPGSQNTLFGVDQRCPTFSWQADPAAEFYEIVVYQLPRELDVLPVTGDEGLIEVLYVRVPKGATSWTPPSDRGLSEGGRYVWFVRPVTGDEQEPTANEDAWSSGLYFTVSTGPSPAEVRQAIETLRRYLEKMAGRHEGRHPDASLERISISGGTPAAVTRSVTNAVAAIRGEQPDLGGETYGVVGQSASPGGAGLGAANTAGGPDLVLDGSADGATDTTLRESGLYRFSDSQEIFTIANPGAGDLTLQVDGAVAATSLNGDGSGVTGVIAADADLLDGASGEFYRDASNIAAGTLGTGYYSAHGDLDTEGYLDLDDGADLVTRDQGDGRYAMTPLSGKCYQPYLGNEYNFCPNGWSPARSASCLVTAELSVECVDQLCTSAIDRFLHVAFYDGTTNSHDPSGGPYIGGALEPGEWETGSHSAIIPVDGTKTYNFGCWVDGWPFEWNTMGMCNVTWLCF